MNVKNIAACCSHPIAVLAVGPKRLTEVHEWARLVRLVRPTTIPDAERPQ